MPQICFAIPTWNRAEKLRICVETIAQQILNLNADAEIFISDNFSTDHTERIIEDLKKKYPFIKSNRRQEHGGVFDNLSDVTELSRGNYIWWFGDDDRLMPNGLQTILKFLGDQSFAFISAGNGSFKPHSGKVVEGTLLSLCNKFGWNQIIGWITGDVLRYDVAQEVCKLMRQEPYKLDAYAHVGASLTAAANKKALHIDVPIVEPLGTQDTEDLERWAKENIGWRYFLLIDTFKHMYEKKILTQKLHPKFFKYLNYYLWDRFIVNMISSALKGGDFPEKGWEIILLMAEMVDDLNIRKNIRTRSLSARSLCESRALMFGQIKALESTLVNIANDTSRPVLPLGGVSS